jgi:hypothetical protein
MEPFRLSDRPDRVSEKSIRKLAEVLLKNGRQEVWCPFSIRDEDNQLVANAVERTTNVLAERLKDFHVELVREPWRGGWRSDHSQRRFGTAYLFLRSKQIHFQRLGMPLDIPVSELLLAKELLLEGHDGVRIDFLFDHRVNITKAMVEHIESILTQMISALVPGATANETDGHGWGSGAGALYIVFRVPKA